MIQNDKDRLELLEERPRCLMNRPIVLPKRHKYGSRAVRQ
jgi:hypothetical protein